MKSFSWNAKSIFIFTQTHFEFNTSIFIKKCFSMNQTCVCCGNTTYCDGLCEECLASYQSVDCCRCHSKRLLKWINDSVLCHKCIESLVPSKGRFRFANTCISCHCTQTKICSKCKYVCCLNATILFCVCSVSYSCVIHTKGHPECIGSHD